MLRLHVTLCLATAQDSLHISPAAHTTRLRTTTTTGCAADLGCHGYLEIEQSLTNLLKKHIKIGNSKQTLEALPIILSRSSQSDIELSQ